MYSRLLLYACERNLYNTLYNIRLQINRLKHTMNRDEETRLRLIDTVSTRFPDYKVIYCFPYIKHASGINVVKHKFTILTGIIVPLIVGLELFNVISLGTSVSLIGPEVTLTIWLHTFGILCNNLVGYVYLNLDKQKVILSYVDYWGERIDFKTSFNDIVPISDNSVSMTDPLYKKIVCLSQKQKLKINIKFGQIIDMENFTCILGTV